MSKRRLRPQDIDSYLAAGNDINYQDPKPAPSYFKPTGRTLLHYAAYNGNLVILKYLANKGANLNVVDSHGWTPLHYAADLDFVVATQDGHVPTGLPTTEALLRLGADDTIVDHEGRTVREMFSKFGSGNVYDTVRRRVNE
jgi:ankyrin repeat protein